MYTDYNKCIGCHICALTCPCGYIQMGMGEGKGCKDVAIRLVLMYQTNRTTGTKRRMVTSGLNQLY